MFFLYTNVWAPPDWLQNGDHQRRLIQDTLSCLFLAWTSYCVLNDSWSLIIESSPLGKLVSMSRVSGTFQKPSPTSTSRARWNRLNVRSSMSYKTILRNGKNINSKRASHVHLSSLEKYDLYCQINSSYYT